MLKPAGTSSTSTRRRFATCANAVTEDLEEAAALTEFERDRPAKTGKLVTNG